MLCCASKNTKQRKGPIDNPAAVRGPTRETNVLANMGVEVIDAEEVANTFNIGVVIGSGHFAEIREAVRNSNGQKLAIKLIDKKDGDEKFFKMIIRESALMREMDHPNIVKCHDVLETSRHIIFAMELAEWDLFTLYISPNSSVMGVEAECIKHILDVLQALEYLHAQKIAHRDLKLENVLVNPGGRCILADFGFARHEHQSDPLRTMCGTLEYAAPEILSEQVYEHSCDIWSLGVMAYLMLCGVRPFWDDDDTKLAKMIMDPAVNHSYDIDEWQQTPKTTDSMAFVNACLQKIPASRPVASELCKHQWLTVSFTAVSSTTPAIPKSRADGQRSLSSLSHSSTEERAEIAQRRRSNQQMSRSRLITVTSNKRFRKAGNAIRAAMKFRMLTRAEPLVLELPDISEEIAKERSQSMASLRQQPSLALRDSGRSSSRGVSVGELPRGRALDAAKHRFAF